MKFDRYIFHARLLPALTIAIPVVLAVSPWLPPEIFYSKGIAGQAAKLGLSGSIAMAMAYVLGQLSRGLGARLEERFWKEWGGRPSTVFLRHRDPSLGARQKLDLHARIRQINPDLHLPAPEEEAEDPVEADHCYERVGSWLRGKTRDAKQFPLLFEDNVAYGFRRNLLALRPYAFLASGVGVVSGMWAFMLAADWLAAVIGSTLIGLYASHNSIADVRRQSEKYTRSLFDALDRLDHQGPARRRPPRRPRGRPSNEDAA